jgi:hypothetical protein
MIQAMEDLLKHWGEQRRRKGLGGTGASPLAGLMDWKGAPPRGEASSVVLLGGAGMDHVAAEVEAVLASLEAKGNQVAEAGACGVVPAETQLVVLAEARYWRQLPLAKQLAEAKCEKSAYYDRVGALHAALEKGLKARHEGTLKDVKRVRRAGEAAKEATLERIYDAEDRRAAAWRDDRSSGLTAGIVQVSGRNQDRR